jgi:hypothetical protein
MLWQSSKEKAQCHKRNNTQKALELKAQNQTQFNSLKRRHANWKFKVTKKITCRSSTPTSQNKQDSKFQNPSSIRSQNEHKKKLDDSWKHQDPWKLQDSRIINHTT